VRLELLGRVRGELEKAARWYERKASLGDAFVQEVDAAFMRIAALPRSYPRHPDAPEARRALVHRFPYAVVFLVESDRVVVIAVTHLKRRPARTSAARGR
jgi:plasmid stabilization system protein ParE